MWRASSSWACAALTAAQPALVCSRTEANARAFARDFGIAERSLERRGRRAIIRRGRVLYRNPALSPSGPGHRLSYRRGSRCWLKSPLPRRGRRGGDGGRSAILGRILHGGDVDALPTARQGVADEDPRRSDRNAPQSVRQFRGLQPARPRAKVCSIPLLAAGRFSIAGSIRWRWRSTSWEKVSFWPRPREGA